MRIYAFEKTVDNETSRHNLFSQLSEGSEFLENQNEALSQIWKNDNPKIVSLYETVLMLNLNE